MTRKPLIDNDLERGERLKKCLSKLFPRTSRAKIGLVLGGYAESAIRKWEKGAPIPNTVLNYIALQHVNLNWLLTGEKQDPNSSSASAAQFIPLPDQLTPETLREVSSYLAKLADIMEQNQQG